MYPHFVGDSARVFSVQLYQSIQAGSLNIIRFLGFALAMSITIFGCLIFIESVVVSSCNTELVLCQHLVC